MMVMTGEDSNGAKHGFIADKVRVNVDSDSKDPRHTK